MKPSAQASVEFIAILAAALIVFSILLTLVEENYKKTRETLDITNTRNSLKEICKTSRLVYSQGDGAKNRVYASIPAGVTETQVGENHINVRVDINNRIHDILEVCDARLSGSIPDHPGNHWITIEAVGSYVHLGERILAANPNPLSYTIYAADDAAEQNVTVENTGSSTENLSFSVSGTITPWITLNPQWFTLTPLEGKNLSVLVDAPAYQAPGVYHGQIKMENSETVYVSVSVRVLAAPTCNKYCTTNGYTQGTCRQNQQQCAINGETHEPGGDSYCTGGVLEDTCCCAP